VGPLPAETYWRRRAVVGLLVVALVAGLVWLLGGRGDDTLEPGERSTADPTAEPTAGSDESDAGPKAEPTAEPAAACADDVLEVEAVSESAEQPAGASARLTLTVRNTGPVPCRRGLGQGAVELVITSGDDRIWSSDDCAPGGDEGEVVLEPGASQSARATWPGTRSAPDCPPEQAAAAPGTYRVNGRVGDLNVPGMVFTVTG
jgi:hypothetical protein